ncbi:MAG: DUF983 domain-containing protein [Bacteroidetes bacterium]|nr:DUF983 domain-containing protein [Bacteroidota bacterium]MCB0841928.1 DUF983 domain-containing protein [Bacteroidota bacterium]
MKNHSKIKSSIHLKCPRCGEAPLFYNRNPYKLKDMGKMYESCQNCGQDFVIEPGFYFGGAMISYTIQMFMIALGALGVYLAGGTKPIHYILPISIFLVVTTPYIVLVSRALWLSIFVKKED